MNALLLFSLLNNFYLQMQPQKKEILFKKVVKKCLNC